MVSPRIPTLTLLQFLVLGVLRGTHQRGRTLRTALDTYSVRRTGPAFYQLMARMEKDRLVEGWYEQTTTGDQLVTERHYRITTEGAAGTRPGCFTNRWPARPRRSGGPMPDFRRGWGRWLPSEAERDWFRPSLEDLRAAGLRGCRLQLATATIWLDCWRVWVLSAPSRHRLRERLGARAVGHRMSAVPLVRKDYLAMFTQDLRRAPRESTRRER